ncbi:MAG: XTP/dITP diphosphatase [Firmicutes bacterium]|nr:XTP/dITP diphosphatase [Bacillota bacterium]
MPASRLVIATHNKGKVDEIRALLDGIDVEVLSLAEFPHVPPVDETGLTFAENAVIKARHAAEATGILAVADDSGIEVDALGGRPGVISARFSGQGATDESNNRKILDLLKDVPFDRRTARFVSVIAVCDPAGRAETATGVCEGVVTFEPRGTSGFGYDPLFLVPQLGKTYAELGLEEKNSVSHRGRALRAARPILLRMLGA